MSGNDVVLLLGLAYIAFLIRRSTIGGELGLFSHLFFVLAILVVSGIVITVAQLLGWHPPWI